MVVGGGISVVRSKFIEDSSNTQQIYITIGFQWYAANAFKLPVVRSKVIKDSSGTQQSNTGSQWYAANLRRLPVVGGGAVVGCVVAREETQPASCAAGAGIQHRRTPSTVRLCCLVLY